VVEQRRHSSFSGQGPAVATVETDHLPNGVPACTAQQHALQRELASAYAERLSLLRCDASDAELAQSASAIRELESSYRGARAQFGAQLGG
jgi:hypothetical protein